MTNLNTVVSNIIRHTRDIVGSQLSTLPNTSFRSVIDRRQKGSIPPLPYITVDSEGYMDQGGWLLEDGAIEATNPANNVTDFYAYYDRNVEFMVEFYCYGENSQDILRTLKGALNFESVRTRMFNDSDIRLVRSGPIVRTPDLESTDFRDSAFMNVRFATVDRFIDFDNRIIRNIGYDGTLEDPSRDPSDRDNFSDQVNDNNN